ncbi:MAG: Na(+) antiporter subunit [Devosia sp.]|nr:Na(+) antiporter subunit [Devosia sp.]
MGTGMTAGPTVIADWLVVLPVLLGLIGATVLLLSRRFDKVSGAVAVLFVVAIIAVDAALLQRVLVDGPVAMIMGNWLPPFGISFAADVLGTALALAGAVVTLVVLVYGFAERSATRSADGYFALVLLLLAGVGGAVLTGDLFNLYVWFEVLLIAALGLLISGRRVAQLDAAIKYGFLNYLGTTVFLIALGLLYGAAGTLNMADLVATAPRTNPAAMAVVGTLFLLAFGLKAAAFPVNSWLPASYHTGSPAVSALFAGLLTKVGVYALLRTLVTVMPGVGDFLMPALVAIAVLTLLLAPLGAIAETNLRRALGFFVIGGIGMVLAGIALGGAQGIAGASLYILQAMLSMAALYLVAGLIETVTGATDTRAMGGVYGASSLVSMLFLVLLLGVAGVPPFLGFWPKLQVLQAGIARSGLAGGGPVDAVALLLIAAILLNAFLTLLAASRLWAHIFWRQGPLHDGVEGAPLRHQHLSRREAWFGGMSAFVLVILILGLGLWPEPLLRGSLIAAGDLLDPARYLAAVGFGGVP